MGLWLSTNAQSNSTPQSSTPTFNINSQTLILDTEGNYIDFKTFISLQPDIDYADLQPKFDDKGNLQKITITLLRKKIMVKEVASNSTTTTPHKATATHTPNKTVTYSNKSPNSTTQTPTTSTNTNKKFRFTTAKELEGKFAPYFKEQDEKGNSYSSASLAGKVIVIKFWFLKCGPCLEEIPQLNTLVDKYKKNKDVTFLAAATDESQDIIKFLQKKSFKYTILANSYNIHGDFKVAGYPTHLIIYKSGMVGRVFTGKNSSVMKNLEIEIEKGLLMLSDDKSLEELKENVTFTSDLIVRAEEGYQLTENEYNKKISTNQYKSYKRIKVNGREEIFLVKSN